MAFGAQGREGSSKQNQGLLPANKPAVSSFVASEAPNVARSLIDWFQNPIVLPKVNKFGLFDQQQNQFNEAVKQATSKISGDAARRGMFRPENIGAIAGAAAQNVAPLFAPLAGQNIEFAATAPIALEAQKSSSVLAALDVLVRALGGQSSGSQSGFSFDAGTGVNTFLTGAL